MRVADYLARAVADFGITQVFMITGGGAMHLNDAFGHEPRLKCLFNHHEQACAIAAEGYARVSGRPALVNVTTGPGGVNALTGVYGAWTDSIPMLIVSGQVKRETLLATYDLPALRQLGDQEVDIISMVRGVTKHCALITDPAAVRYELEKALHLATSGRPGPCWLDVPIDVQSAQIDPAALQSYEPDPAGAIVPANLSKMCADILGRLREARRPVVMPGTGVRLADALGPFDAVVRKLRIPVVPAWTAIDVVPSDDELYCGRAGTIGDRAGNFAVQNADLLLVVGSRLNIRQVSYNWGSFARHAFKIQVDVDRAELEKPTVRPDLPVHCDARLFLEEMNRQLTDGPYRADRHSEWLEWCKSRVAKYPVVQESQRSGRGRGINPYHFMDRLFHHLAADDVVACGDGTASVVTFQAGVVKRGQRVFANSGCAAMGYDLPSAVGAACATGGGRVICLAGDGSVQLNIQELQTVVHHQLPIKMFVLNNGGYLSMRLSQGSFFGRFVGESPRSGISFPDIVSLARAYGLPAGRAEGGSFEEAIDNALRAPGPFVCEVMLDPDQGFEPKLSSRQLEDGRIVSSALEDLYPFLSREELAENMVAEQEPLTRNR